MKNMTMSIASEDSMLCIHSIAGCIHNTILCLFIPTYEQSMYCVHYKMIFFWLFCISTEHAYWFSNKEN